MKVALLSDPYLPRLGGIEVQTHDLARTLTGLGHEVVVFTATPDEAGRNRGAVTQVDGIEVHRLGLNLPAGLLANPWAGATLRARLRAGAFDAVHVQTGVLSPFAWDGVRVAASLGLPTAMTWHCMLARAAPAFVAPVRWWAARGVAMSAVSAVAAAPLRRVLGDGRVSVLPNGIDVARWAVGPVERTPGPLRLVTAMRLEARKRPLALVELVAQVAHQTGNEPQLTILGDGSDRSRVEKAVAALGLSRVDLPGRVTRDELRARYAASDVYVSPARLEAFGIAPLEARTVGLPVVGRAGSGVGEFVTDGVNGRIVGSDAAMAAALAELAADPQQVARMRAHNIEHPPSQDWPAVAQLALAEYARAVAQPDHSRRPR